MERQKFKKKKEKEEYSGKKHVVWMDKNMKKEEEKFLSTCLNGKDGKKLKLY